MNVAPGVSESPSRVSGVWRYLARLLVIACVPMVIMSSADLATAAATYGAPGRWEVTESLEDSNGLPDGIGGWRMTCSGTGAVKADAPNDTRYTVVGKIVCDISVRQWNDPEPGDLTNSSVSILYRGATADGQECTYAMAPLTGDLLTTQSYESVSTHLPCAVAEVCVTAYAEDPGTMSRHDSYSVDSMCSAVAMTVPKEDKGHCLFGTPYNVTTWTIAGSAPFYAGYYGKRLSYSVSPVPPGNPYALQGTRHQFWYHQAKKFTLGTPDGGNYWLGGPTSDSEGQWQPHPGPYQTKDIGAGNLNPNPSGEPAQGVWIFATRDHNSFERPATGQAGTADAMKTMNQYQWGDNDPANCVFYYGPKFRDDPNSTLDDPMGDLEETPELEEDNTIEPDLDPDPVTPDGGDPCDFKFSDPTTWVSAGICQLVELVKALINVVAGLPARIANAIGALFIPERSLSSRVQELEGEFEDRFPFNVGDSLASMGISPGGGTDGRVPIASASGSGGCPAWDVIVDVPNGGETYDAVCDSSFTSAIRGARPIILAGLLAAAFWPLVRGLFFASVPVIKPVPTSDR